MQPSQLSEQRIATARRAIRGENIANHPGLSDAARVMYVVGFLICDATGFIEKAKLDRAMRDENTVSQAVDLLFEAGWQGENS